MKLSNQFVRYIYNLTAIFTIHIFYTNETLENISLKVFIKKRKMHSRFLNNFTRITIMETIFVNLK